MTLKSKPPHTRAELRAMLSSSLLPGVGSEPDTYDAADTKISTHRGFENDVPPVPGQHGLQVNPKDHDASRTQNKALADAIQQLFTTGTATWGPKNNVDKFVLTWRMHPKPGVAVGACGCGCGCG
jgi:hypothetical protein